MTCVFVCVCTAAPPSSLEGTLFLTWSILAAKGPRKEFFFWGGGLTRKLIDFIKRYLDITWVLFIALFLRGRGWGTDILRPEKGPTTKQTFKNHCPKVVRYLLEQIPALVAADDTNSMLIYLSLNITQSVWCIHIVILALPLYTDLFCHNFCLHIFCSARLRQTVNNVCQV